MKNLGIREDDIDVQRMWSWNELAADQYLTKAEYDLVVLNLSVRPLIQMCIRDSIYCVVIYCLVGFSMKRHGLTGEKALAKL